MSVEQRLVTNNLQDLGKGLLIKSALLPVSPSDGNITYKAVTFGSNNWQLQIVQYESSTPSQIAINLDYSRIFKLLSSREVKNISFSNESECNHALNVLFLATNWDTLNPLFRPVTENITTPRCFIEVNLGKSGRADLIGIQSDGTILIIEVGRGRKSKQVTGYVRALRNELGRSVNIKGLIALYNIEESLSMLHIGPPRPF